MGVYKVHDIQDSAETTNRFIMKYIKDFLVFILMLLAYYFAFVLMF